MASACKTLFAANTPTHLLIGAAVLVLAFASYIAVPAHLNLMLG